MVSVLLLVPSSLTGQPEPKGLSGLCGVALIVLTMTGSMELGRPVEAKQLEIQRVDRY